MRTLLLYCSPKLLVVLALGFFSGLPLALTGSTLTTWLSDAKVPIALIGIAAAVATPYSLKFLWSPLVDNMKLPFFTQRFGRRRGWLLCTQIVLVATIAALALSNPSYDATAANPTEHLGWIMAIALVLAYVSATQDIIIDALRTEMLSTDELGYGSVMTTLGYRVGMLVSGAGCLYLADCYSWPVAYGAMAGVALLGVALTLFIKEPASSATACVEISARSFGDLFRARMRQFVVVPFANFMERKGWMWLLLFIASYKLGDAFLGNMTNPFLREIGFTKSDIASVVKVFGLGATLAGSFFGAWIVHRYGLIRPLLIGGFFHAITNLMFLWQAKVGADIHVLMLGITLENFTGGISSVILVVMISSLCDLRFTATQYALLSSLATLGRTTLSTTAGLVVQKLGWEQFFIFSVVLALPSLILLYFIQKYMEKEDVKVRQKN